MLIAEALGNPRNYPLDERVFAAFGYLSDSVRVGALRFARWCAYGAASPPIGLLLSHRALFRIFPCPSEPLFSFVGEIIDLPRKNTDSVHGPVRAKTTATLAFPRGGRGTASAVDEVLPKNPIKYPSAFKPPPPAVIPEGNSLPDRTS